jgi:hypothetical protein
MERELFFTTAVQQFRFPLERLPRDRYKNKPEISACCIINASRLRDFPYSAELFMRVKAPFMNYIP